MSLAPQNIETAVRRALADILQATFPDTTVVRSLLSDPPEGQRLTVLPGQSPASAAAKFIGSVAGRVWRDEEFTVRVWVEVFDTDLDDVEDRADALAWGVEEIPATNPDLDDMAGIISFGGTETRTATRTTQPAWQPQTGFFFQLIQIEFPVHARYD